MDTLVLRDSITGGMTDEEFMTFCLENPGLRIERKSNFEVVIMPPVTTLSAFYSGEVYGQLRDWNRIHKGGIVFDSSAGFTLPDRSVISPDASWISKERWNGISEEDKNKFSPICPDFVIEVRSKSDNLDALKIKMTLWLKNQAKLAWLVDPIEGATYIFKPGRPEERIQGFNKKVYGEMPVEGFELDLTQLKI